MAKHYALKNKFARAKLKGALTELKALEEKDKEKLGILVEASLQASQTP